MKCKRRRGKLGGALINYGLERCYNQITDCGHHLIVNAHSRYLQDERVISNLVQFKVL